MEKNDIVELKKYSKSEFKNEEKGIINTYNIKKDTYNMGVFITYIPKHDIYEVYCFIEDHKNIATGLYYKTNKNKLVATSYYDYLVLKIDKYKTDFFFNQ